MRLLHPLCLVLLFLTGCCKTSKVVEYDVTNIVSNRIEQEVYWDRDAIYHDCALELLQQPLTADSVVQIALLNNPGIQASFEKIGIAHADLVQASLLPNPFLSGFALFPEQSGIHLNYGLSLVTSLLDFFLTPLRTQIATAEFQQMQLSVAHEVLKIAFDTQEVFYQLQAAEAQQQPLSMLVEVADISATLAQAQNQAGNITPFALQEHLIRRQEARLALQENQNTIIHLREQMNRLLGLGHEDTQWCLSTSQSEILCEACSPDYYVELALSNRLAIAAKKWEIEKIAHMYATKQWWAYTNTSAGISAEQDAEGARVIGPSLSGSIPLFNRGQADRERLDAMLYESKAQLRELEVNAAADVREAAGQLAVRYRLVVQYRDQLMPLQQQITAMAQEYYNTMLEGPFALLQYKRNEFETLNNYRLALRDYWLSHVALERAIEGGFPCGNQF